MSARRWAKKAKRMLNFSRSRFPRSHSRHVWLKMAKTRSKMVLVKIFRIWKGSSLSRIQDLEFSLFSWLWLFFHFLWRANASGNNKIRNCIKNGVIAKTCSNKVYSLQYGTIAKMVEENENPSLTKLSRKWSRNMRNPSCTKLTRKRSRFYIHKGVFDFAMIPYLLVYGSQYTL